MASRVTLAALIVVAVPVAGMTAVSACGSTSDNTMMDAMPDITTQDVAPDVAKEAAPDAGPDLFCPDVSVSSLIPDGGVDADTGAVPLAACLGCFETNCSSQISACNKDCSCENGVISTVQCVIMTGDYQTCFSNAILGADSTEQALFLCALSDCKNVCLPSGSDGGSSDASGQ
jgi:hypothetical protein